VPLPAGGVGQVGLYISPTLQSLPPANTQYPFFLLRRDKHGPDVMPGQHRLQIAVRRPDAVDAVLRPKAPRLPGVLKLDGRAAFRAAAGEHIGFQHQRAQSALGQVERGGQSRDASADDDNRVVSWW